tara:strand:+ start:43107 stop:44369 length:1263 start_codon:yes stop_codon:yes gene_type:complete
MEKRKITCDPQNIAVRDVVRDYDAKRMAIVKDFQRRLVWKKKTIDQYIESVSEGTAVSGIIVADIESGTAASKTIGDLRGIKRYEKFYNEGKRTINEDGQNRLRKGLIQFVNNDITFTGTLYDLEYKPREFVNIKFEKLPKEFQHAFLSSTVLVVTIKNAPFRKLPAIFRKLNAGNALNRTEIRQSFQTEIANWMRKHCEGQFVEMWPRFTGCSRDKILRMRDIEWMTQAFLTCNSYTKNRNFGNDDMDWFFKIGEEKPMSKVQEYDIAERQRFITILETVHSTVQQQQAVPASKTIPQRTFWALLMVAEYFYDSNGKYKIHSYDQFYRDVYGIDSRLVTDSKILQSQDIKSARANHPHLSDDEITKELAPDNNYYWRQTNRTQSGHFRALRRDTLIAEVNQSIKAGIFTSISAPEEAAA